MPRADDPLLPLLGNYSIARWTERENARNADGGDSRPDLVRLISGKLMQDDFRALMVARRPPGDIAWGDVRKKESA